MKQKSFNYPDWSNPVGQIITRADNAGRKSVWKEYQQDDKDELSLYVTVEITGSVYMPFEQFSSSAERDAEWKERDRRGAWRNALAFAEHLWKNAPHRDYVVMYRPENPDNPYIREGVYIYRRLPPLVGLKETEGGTCG